MRAGAFSRGARGGNPSQERAFSPGSARVSLAEEHARGGNPSQERAFSPGCARVSLVEERARGEPLAYKLRCGPWEYGQYSLRTTPCIDAHGEL